MAAGIGGVLNARTATVLVDGCTFDDAVAIDLGGYVGKGAGEAKELGWETPTGGRRLGP